MRLVSVFAVRKAPDILYDLLKQRPEYANISHKKIPSIKQHRAFVRSHPYSAWYLIEVDKQFVGSIYLTRNSEIGVHCIPEFRRWESPAVRMLMEKSSRTGFLVNISPRNHALARKFRRMDFKLLQITYELCP